MQINKEYADARKQEWKTFKEMKIFGLLQAGVIFSFGALLIACWFWHHDCNIYKNRLNNYVKAEEKFFKEAGKYPYEVYQEFMEDVGNDIIEPPYYGPMSDDL